ncbi:MAG: beta/gamma crystallin-related protein [Alphaproteobacteria bacterium]|jgi:hypothetical protein
MPMRNIITLALVAAGGLFLSVAALAAGPAPAPLPPSTITLYEKPNFQGRSMTFTSRVASLNAVGFNDVAQSVKIDGKRDWVLCESRNFLGRCIRVHLKEKDLKRQKFSGLASSIYPVPDPRPAKPK